MQPLIWLGILAVLLVIEAITAGLTTIWFAGGALIAAIASYVGAGVMAQILLFLCISLVLLIFTMISNGLQEQPMIHRKSAKAPWC